MNKTAKLTLANVVSPWNINHQLILNSRRVKVRVKVRVEFRVEFRVRVKVKVRVEVRVRVRVEVRVEVKVRVRVNPGPGLDLAGPAHISLMFLCVFFLSSCKRFSWFMSTRY